MNQRTNPTNEPLPGFYTMPTIIALSLPVYSSTQSHQKSRSRVRSRYIVRQTFQQGSCRVRIKKAIKKYPRLIKRCSAFGRDSSTQIWERKSRESGVDDTPLWNRPESPHNTTQYIVEGQNFSYETNQSTSTGSVLTSMIGILYTF